MDEAFDPEQRAGAVAALEAAEGAVLGEAGHLGVADVVYEAERGRGAAVRWKGGRGPVEEGDEFQEEKDLATAGAPSLRSPIALQAEAARSLRKTLPCGVRREAPERPALGTPTQQG